MAYSREEYRKLPHVKAAQKIAQRKYYLKNKDKILLKRKIWMREYRKRPEIKIIISNVNRKYREAHKKEGKEYGARWRAANPSYPKEHRLKMEKKQE